jgi:hypothetical protein
VILVAFVAACQNNAQPVPSPTPSPSPHTPVAETVLQQGDVPSGLSPCAGSGPIDAYIASLQSQAALASRLTDDWQSLRTLGATSASISLFTSDATACSAELAAASNAKSAAGFVAVFADEGQADRAWQAGVLGFVPPAVGELPPGVNRGTATGLGVSAWTYTRTPVQLACWHKSVFVALIVLTNLDANAFKAATAGVDARLN